MLTACRPPSFWTLACRRRIPASICVHIVISICVALDSVAPSHNTPAALAVVRSCAAGPGGEEDAAAKWARLRAELLPAARQQAERAAQRSPLAGISSGALTCLALRQAGCTNLACTNLVGSSERGLQLKLCSRCKVGGGAECWGHLQCTCTCLLATCSGLLHRLRMRALGVLSS